MTAVVERNSDEQKQSKKFDPLVTRTDRAFHFTISNWRADWIDGLRTGRYQPPAYAFDGGGWSARYAWCAEIEGLPPGGARVLARAMNREVAHLRWDSLTQTWFFQA